MPKYYIRRTFRRKPGAALGGVALHVADCLDGNISFPALPITLAILRSKAAAFADAVAACVDGRKLETVHKNTLRAELIALLNEEADYVEVAAKNDQEVLLSSGFDVGAGNPPTPVGVGLTAILAVLNEASTKLRLKLLVAHHARSYEVQMSIVPGVWVFLESFSDPHDVVLTDLVPGTVYAIRARALGSKNQRSEWCLPVSHMAT